MNTYGYPNLASKCGWRPGIHRAPHGYQHRWLVVATNGTIGFDSRAEARSAWSQLRSGTPIEAIQP